MVVRFHSFVVNSNHLMINIHLESRHGELFDLLGAGQESQVMIMQLSSMQVTRFV